MRGQAVHTASTGAGLMRTAIYAKRCGTQPQSMCRLKAPHWKAA